MDFLEKPCLLTCLLNCLLPCWLCCCGYTGASFRLALLLLVALCCGFGLFLVLVCAVTICCLVAVDGLAAVVDASCGPVTG